MKKPQVVEGANADGLKNFEKPDVWPYKLLLQNLYTDCINANGNPLTFPDAVDRLDECLADFPGRDLRTIVDKQKMLFHDKWMKERLRLIGLYDTGDYRINCNRDTYIRNVNLIVNYKYSKDIFRFIRDTLSSIGAFNVSPHDTELGFQL